MNFFKSSSSKTKTPPELIRSTRDAIQKLDSTNSSPETKRKVSLLNSSTRTGQHCVFGPLPLLSSLSQCGHDPAWGTHKLTSRGPPFLLQASEDISKNLFQMKLLLYGDGGQFRVLTWSGMAHARGLEPSLLALNLDLILGLGVTQKRIRNQK